MKVTNATLVSVEAGSHIVQILLDDYVDYDETVTVTAGETAIVNAPLVKHTIDVTAPSGNDTWQIGSDKTITWETNGGSSVSTASRMNRGIGHVRQVARMSRLRNIRSHPGTRESRAQNKEMRDGISSRGKQRSEASPYHPERTASERSIDNTLNVIKNPRTESFDKMNLSTLHQKHRSLGQTQLLTVRNVKIELHQIGYGKRLDITSNTSNTGTFPWIVDESLQPGSGYFVRIFSISDPSVTGDSEQFSIVSNPSANKR